MANNRDYCITHTDQLIDSTLNILIVGGTGTLGRNLAQRLLGANSKQEISIYSRDEVKQLEMMQDFPSEKYPNLGFMLGDIRDKERLHEACGQKDIVINAAAVKHVVMAEKNPDECYKTNVIGTKNLVETCNENHVGKCLLISTDKAIEPSSVYGKSKKEAEDLIIDANEKLKGKFSIVRFGNILGSRASVSEIFKKMARSGRLTITDSKATRFGINIGEAVDFLVEKTTKMNGGEVFTPQMKAFRVIDLAQVIAPGNFLDIVGLRPGDKLHEAVVDEAGQYLYSNEAELMGRDEIILALNPTD